MLVQSLGFNLMSISKLCDMGMLVLFSASRCVVFSQDDYSFIFEGYQKGDLYIVDFSSGPAVSTCLMAKATSGWLWHRRLGHAGMKNLQTLVKKKHIVGLNEVKLDKDRLCSDCEAGKITKKHHSAKTIMTATRLLNCYIWISLVLKIMLAWEETSMVSLLLMISLISLGFSF